MTINSNDLIQARMLIGGILDELHIDAYLFEIEPREDHWELKVECAINEGWGSYRVALQEEQLQAGFNGADARRQLQEQCRLCFDECMKGQR
jgi:hypothetical protein